MVELKKKEKFETANHSTTTALRISVHNEQALQARKRFVDLRSRDIEPGKGAATGGALNAGVITPTKGLAADLAEKRIRVNVIVPGLVKTELWGKLGKSEEEQEQQFEHFGAKFPVGFVATPDDIAEAYLYLAKANYATGTSVLIDGGALL